MIFALGIAVLVLANFASTSAMHQVGDMILTDDQYENLPSDQKIDVEKHENKRNAIKGERYRWPGGVIYYTIDRSFSPKDLRIVREAMDIWSKYTCLSFRPASPRDRNQISIKDGYECSSKVGMVGGRQPLILKKIPCRNVRTVLHELGHAIGLYHTHNRPDRDQHLNIDLSGVEQQNHKVFDKKRRQEVNQYGVNYDYHSIMHYGNKDFGDYKGNVIETKNPEFQNVIGKAETLSFGDIEMVNKMYKCTPSSCTLKDSDCPGISFVGASCECLCPGPNKSQLVQPC